MRKLFLLALIAAAVYYINGHQLQPASPAATESHAADSTDDLQRAFENQQSNAQVEGSGVVENVLSDDNDGSRHQRFIVRMPSGLTILIAHNIDLAPRVSPLARGDRIEFSGEYEWSNKGGVVHWTHRDPSGRHRAGWLKHDGQMVQ
jgi:hypothetical protein